MKKLFQLFILVMSTIVVSAIFSTAYGQKSKIYSGDKSAREIRKSVDILNDRIISCQERIKSLETNNDRLLIRCRATNDQLLTGRYYQKINYNDSIIDIYYNEIASLEKGITEFVDRAAGKDVQNYADLRGKPMEVANANLLVAYANAMSNGKSSDMSAVEMDENDGSSLRGVIVNQWHQRVTAKVTGPGNFYREFDLDARNGKAVFKLPFPGNYTTTFYSAYESKSITKPVGPNIVYHDDKGGQYDYKATLPRGY